MIKENKRLDGPVKKYGELMAKEAAEKTREEVTKENILRVIDLVPIEVIAERFQVSIEYIGQIIKESKKSDSGINSFTNM